MSQSLREQIEQAMESSQSFVNIYILLSELDALEKANQWQPIEELPEALKDDHWVLATNGIHVGVVKWVDPPFTGCDEFQDECGEWVSGLTHFRELPQPPTTSQKEAKS